MEKWGFIILQFKLKFQYYYAFIDFETKIAGIAPPFYPTGDVEKRL